MRLLKRVPEEFWWDVARQCNYATFYHTPLWKEVAVRTFPGLYQDETFGAILPSGVRVVFPLLSKRRIGPLRWLQSTFENSYGGFIADGPVLQEEASELYKQACQWSTYTFYNISNPIGPNMPYGARELLNALYSEPTYLVPLDADFDTVFSRFQKTQRKDYRRGLRNGVEVRQANSIADYQAYYQIYRDAVERWGEDTSYGFNWRLFEVLYQLSLSHPEHIKLWVFTLEEKIVGGTVAFYWGQLVSAWNGTAHRDFLSYDVMPVGDTEMIRDAIGRGYQYFDFNTSNLNEGVMTYKKRFGTITRPVSMWRFENPLLRPVQQLYWRRTGIEVVNQR